MTTELSTRNYWTKEPDEPPHYSDWKITIVRNKDTSGDDDDDDDDDSNNGTVKAPIEKKSVTYAVHRNIIGPNSEYFTRVFLSSCSDNGGGSSFSESQNQHSNIDFPHTLSDKAFGFMIDAFELLLDDCYLQSKEKWLEKLQTIDPPVVVALWYLGDYFQMKDDVLTRVERFLKGTLSAAKSADDWDPESQFDKIITSIYAIVIDFRAADLNVRRVQDELVKSCYFIGHQSLSGDTELADVADLPFWLDIVSFDEKNGSIGTDSKDWSNNIAYFLDQNNNDDVNMDFNAFKKLTSENMLTDISPESALVFLKFERSCDKKSSDVQYYCLFPNITFYSGLHEDTSFHKQDLGSYHPPPKTRRTSIVGQNRQTSLYGSILLQQQDLLSDYAFFF